MSEDFDKEAEREKLREQFERDEKRRKATRKMSDLLLKGATMTNKHCDQCGSPIFRYEGQEFCPECQAVVGGEGEGAAETAATGEAPDAEPATAGGETTPETPAEAAESADEPEPSPDSKPSSEPEPSPNTQPGIEPGSTARPSPNPTQEPDSRPDESAMVGSDLGHPTVRPDEPSESRQPTRQREPAVEAGGGPVPAETGDLAEAQASLRDALTRFANRAAETDDPRQAREYLAAAREAAEALAALRR
jgi:uncharacterized Zn finger protein (UPF0148 family)